MSLSDTYENEIEILIPEAFRFLTAPKRYKILYGGRGGAKSHNVARSLLVMGMERRLRIVCAREIQKSIKDSVHELLADLIRQYDLGFFYEVQEAVIKGCNGTQFKFRGLKHNTTDLKSLEGADILWIEEAENVSDNSYEIVIPTLRKESSEIWISFNTKNVTDPTYQRFVTDADDDVAVKKVSWRDNPFFPAVLERERLRLLKSDPEAYAHIWEGEPDTRYSGAVYAKKVAALNEAGRMVPEVRHDPAYPVYVTWDLGYGDATTLIFFQVGNGEVFIIDYYESNMEDMRHYAEVMYGREIIIDERDLKTGEVLRWRFGEGEAAHIDPRRRAYQYHASYMPHDSGYELQAASGRSILSQMQRFEIKSFCIPAAEDRDRHEAAWSTLPKCWINSEYCRDLTSALMHYHFDYDEDLKRFGKKPVHDWSSHACSSFELMSRMWREKSITQKELDGRAMNNKFHRLRAENNLDKVDPYRVKPMMGERR